MSYTSQQDPDSGGVKIDDKMKRQVKQRISYAHDKYETSVFPNGEFFDTPELAVATAADFHL